MVLNAKRSLLCIYSMSEKSVTSSQEHSSEWAVIMGQLVDKFVGKNMAMTYNFDNLTIDMPKAQGPDGLHLGSVKWTINGKIIIATEAYKKQDVIIGSRKNVKP
jgi:hypothetical protein